jgi:hypothetical protein
MRTVGVVAAGAVISFLVAICVLAGEAFLGLVAQPGPHQGFEIVAVMIGMAIVAVGSAIIFSIVLAVGGRAKGYHADHHRTDSVSWVGPRSASDTRSSDDGPHGC